jgi:hypothetical protein
MGDWEGTQSAQVGVAVGGGSETVTVAGGGTAAGDGAEAV